MNDYGVLIVIAAVFVVLSSGILSFLLWMYKKSNKDNHYFMTKMFESQQKMFDSQQTLLQSILDFQKANNASIYQLKESLTGEDLNRIRTEIEDVK